MTTARSWKLGRAFAATALMLAACRSLIGYDDAEPAIGGDAGGDGASTLPLPSGSQDGSAADGGPDARPAPGDGATPPLISCKPPTGGPPQSCDASVCGEAGIDCCSSPLLDGRPFRAQNTAEGTYLCPYRLDAFEVTVGRFRRFVEAFRKDMIDAGAGANPNNSLDPGWLPAFTQGLPENKGDLETALDCQTGYSTWTASAGPNENLPINCVTWFEASAFCAWDNGRLPTRVEWSFAAVGADAQLPYPWGTTDPGMDTNLAIYGCYRNPSGGTCAGTQNIAPVGSVTAGNARWGQADLGGNVAEWIQDHGCSSLVTCINCACLTGTATGHMVFGGDFRHLGYLETDTAVNSNTKPPETRLAEVGFRCARHP